MDYENQIKAAVVSGFGSAVVDQTRLSALSVNEQLIVYWNWCARGIPPRSYRVHKSRDLIANPLASDPAYKAALDRIEQLLSSGGDLTPYLSRRIMHGFEVPAGPSSNLASRRDLDLLINDWGIHHLHLSNEVQGDGFVKRTGPLLFAAFVGQDAYLIEILQHGGWTDVKLIEVCVREWPQANLALEMKGVLGLAREVRPDERKALRNGAVNTPIEVAGKYYMGRMGMSTAGTSIQAARAADRLLSEIRQFATLAQSNPSEVETMIRAAGGNPPSNPNWEFTFLDGGFGVVDRQSGTALQLG